MKRKLTAILVGATVLGMVLGTLGSPSVNAQSPEDQPSEDAIDWLAAVPFNTNDQVIDHESNPAVETRNLQEEFSGTNLTPQQFEQIRQARRQFRAELRQVLTGDLGKIIQLVFLPQVQAEQQAGQVFGHSIANYSHAVSQILTPEQLQIWQQNLEQPAQRNGENEIGEFDGTQ